MPRGKEFCPFENDYFALAEFDLVDGTLIHRKHPPHRATDGILVVEKDGKVFPISQSSFGVLSDRQRQQ